MTDTRDTVEALMALPELPEPVEMGFLHDSVMRRLPCHGYTADQMREYARDALRSALQSSPAWTTERIDRIAELVVKGMPDGIQGFCKVWGWQQFARALFDVSSVGQNVAQSCASPDARDSGAHGVGE